MSKYQLLASTASAEDESVSLFFPANQHNAGSNNNNNDNNNPNNPFAIDADELGTMEVPLLHHSHNNNNSNHGGSNKNDFEQLPHTHTSGAELCHCALPGFGANLVNKSTQEAKFKILCAISVCCIFMIIEFLGGYFAGSLAIMTDAAHLASDCITFVIGLVSIWLGSRPPDGRMSFGYKRLEVMGALISIMGIWILTATLVLVAIQRIYSNDYDLDANSMMIIAALGILINIGMVFILHGSALLPAGAHGHSHSGGHGHSHSHAHAHVHSHAAPATALDIGPQHKPCDSMKHEKNLNLRAALIHVIGDLVQSVGVFLAAVLIKFCPTAKFADPLCTLLFSIIVICTTVQLFKESVCILLDAVPTDISVLALEQDLANIEGVKSVHHINVWHHTADHSILMVHLVIDLLSDSNTVLTQATQLACGSEYNIKHCTIQIERLAA